MSLRHAALLCTVSVALAACGGGTKLVKHAQPPQVQRALAEATDQRLSASLQWVIVRNGPGAWARNADWDEYLIRVSNVSPEPVQITEVAVFDSLGTRIESRPNRKQLVRGSKQTARRYRTSGLKVKAGMGGAGLVATGTAIGVVGYGAAVGTAAGELMGGAAVAGGAATAISALLIAGPAFAVVGIVRAVHNSQVNGEIVRRQTALPVSIAANNAQSIDIFFPLAPSPGRVEISYVDAQGQHHLDLDTREALAGLHLGSGEHAASGVAAGAPGAR